MKPKVFNTSLYLGELQLHMKNCNDQFEQAFRVFDEGMRKMKYKGESRPDFRVLLHARIFNVDLMYN